MAIEWKNVSLFVGIPSMRGVQLEVLSSMLVLAAVASQRGVAMHFTGAKMPRTSAARGHIAYNFLQSGCTHLLFIDDDVQFDPASVLTMIERDVPVIGVAYRTKTQDPRLQEYDGGVGANFDEEPIGGTIRVQNLGSGFLLIKRHVIEQLAAAHPAYQWRPGINCLGMFNEIVHQGQFQMEDTSFCIRWRALGGELHLLLDAPTVHLSGEHSWPGNYVEAWNRRRAQRGPGAQPIAQ